MAEILTDPTFGDATQWTGITVSGSAVVYRGMLTGTGFLGQVEPVDMPTLEVGFEYNFEVDCVSLGVGTDAYITVGNRLIWVNAHGVGNHTGTFTPISTNPLWIANDNAGDFVFSKVSISNGNGNGVLSAETVQR